MGPIRRCDPEQISRLTDPFAMIIGSAIALVASTKQLDKAPALRPRSKRVRGLLQTARSISALFTYRGVQINPLRHVLCAVPALTLLSGEAKAQESLTSSVRVGAARCGRQRIE